MSGLEIFTTTIALVDTAIKHLAAIRDKYEEYKKCPALLKGLRKRAKRIKKTLRKHENDYGCSEILQEVLERVRDEFHSLNRELEDVNRSLRAQSKVEKWFSSMKPATAFESITLHLKSLENHLDVWRLMFDVKEELQKLHGLIRRMMVDSQDWREDRERFMHMLSTPWHGFQAKNTLII